MENGLKGIVISIVMAYIATQLTVDKIITKTGKEYQKNTMCCQPNTTKNKILPSINGELKNNNKVPPDMIHNIIYPGNNVLKSDDQINREKYIRRYPESNNLDYASLKLTDFMKKLPWLLLKKTKIFSQYGFNSLAYIDEEEKEMEEQTKQDLTDALNYLSLAIQENVHR